LTAVHNSYVTGHKKEIRPGVWKLRVSAGLDPVTGRYRYLSKTIEGGPRIAERTLAELVASSKDSKSAVTLERLIEESISSGKGLAPKTVQGYREIAKNHIIPALGSKRIDAITGRDLDNFYRKTTDKGLSDAITHHAHALISRPLGQAVKWGWIDKNVAKLASPPNAKRSVASAPSPEELGQILTETSLRSPQIAAIFALCALTGARRGEALALHWSDYNSDTRTLTITRSLGYTTETGIYEKSTKTHGIRRIGIDETLEGVIFSQIEALKKNTELGFELVPDPYLFFGEPDGSTPLHPDTPSRLFRKVCDSLHLPYHLHQLRHFTATQLIAAGVDARTVSGRLGHADASVTLRVYSHVLEAQDRTASEYLGSRVFIPKPIDRA
jgi:integrase